MTLLFPIENEDQQLFVAFAVVFAIIPSAMVSLRVVARRRANRILNLSDWLMIAACVSATRPRTSPARLEMLNLY